MWDCNNEHFASARTVDDPERPSCSPVELCQQRHQGLRQEHVKEQANYKGNAMTAIEALLIERLKKLPPSRVAEVVDFVEFLSQREERAAAAQRLTQGLARLDALNLPPVSDDEVEAEIQAARQERRARQDA